MSWDINIDSLAHVRHTTFKKNFFYILPSPICAFKVRSVIRLAVFRFENESYKLLPKASYRLFSSNKCVCSRRKHCPRHRFFGYTTFENVNVGGKPKCFATETHTAVPIPACWWAQIFKKRPVIIEYFTRISWSDIEFLLCGACRNV